MSSLPTTPPAFYWYFIKKQKWQFLLVGLLHLGWAADWMLMPYFFKNFVAAVMNYTGDKANAWDVIAFPVACVIFFWVFCEILYRSTDFLWSRIYPQFEANIRMAMVDYISQHSHKFFSEHFAGDLANKIDNIRDAAVNIMRMFLTLFFPSFFGIIIGTAMFAHLHPLFGMVVFIWFFTHIAICLVFAKKCNNIADAHSESRSQITGQIVDLFSNVSSTRLFAHAPWEKKRLYNYQAEEQGLHKRVLSTIFGVRVILGSWCFIMMGFTMVSLMVYQWQRDVITAAELSYIFYAGWGICVMAWVSGIELPNLFKELGKSRQALRPIKALHEITDVNNAKQLIVNKGKIEFDNVTFHYARNNNIFKNKSVTIEAASKVGLVGFSGSGKTTFVNLILRIFDIESGRIMIDGQNIAEVTQESLRANIALIPQDTSLFHRSLMDNIRYGRIDATDDEVIAASKQAHCHEFVEKVDEGYNSMVGERGVKLSGGQRQRIAIARAILKDAPILILDEATSALDSVTEKLIQDGLKTLMQGRTTIVIAHRLSTLSEMDRILVFDKGHIIEDGTHKQLLKAKGHYAHMWEMQSGGFLPEVEE
jgi:ATP-binding cassette subfamily B protein